MPRPRRLALGAAVLLALTTACEPEEPTEPEETSEPGEAEPEAPAEPEEPDDPAPGDEEEPAAAPPDAVGVSAGHPDAVDAGMEVLDAGGTAVDAAVAAAFASGVSEPFTSGLGGGGAALVLEHDAEPRAYDYREVVAQDGRIPDSNTGVPGFAAGMERLRSEHGALSLADLVAPSIDLAEGTEVSGLVAERLASDAGALPTDRLPHLYPGGTALSAGDTMVQEDLADTLRIIADEGPDGFYEGEIAATLDERVDGLDAQTLAAYQVQSTEPPTGSFGDHELIGAAPPLGGTTLIQQLQIAEELGLADAPPESADAVHALGVAWQVALAHHEWDLGDPDFVDVEADELVDPDRNAALAQDLDLASLADVDPAEPRGGTDPNTTHITAVDDDGTMVSMTNTITNFWGSRQYQRGFFLNDHLSRFSDGRGQANAPEPGKRPVTWSLPMLVADEEGRPVLGLGSPGGPRIPNTLAGALNRWALHDQQLTEVVEAPRHHVDGTTLDVEGDLEGLRDDLLGRGWTAVDAPGSRLHFGSIQALEIDYEAGEVRGASDPRREADHRIEPR